MKFIDWFAGIGGFRRGMELCGHECVGFCEFDKYAVMSYTSMHLITDEQREHLATLDIKARQKEILKEEYRNGEWYANDVRTVDARSLPAADCWCFGFPCQDISVANRFGKGFSGNRSSLFFRIMYLLGQLPEESRPNWLFIENVKNLLSVNGGWDFARLLVEMDRGGYDAEWQVLNSKYFGVPQNRERCFIIGHLRGRSTAEVFPVEGADAADCIHIEVIGYTRESKIKDKTRIISADGVSSCLLSTGYKEPVKVGLSEVASGGRDQPGTPKKQCYIAIRKLTPMEYFRLQGWSDDYFEKAEFVNCDSQLYKQAGNGVTVNVIKAIAERMEI